MKRLSDATFDPDRSRDLEMIRHYVDEIYI
jgi:hypothetical protein